MHRDVADKALELGGLGDEVGLAVDLDQHADAAAHVDVGLHNALSRDAAGLLLSRSDALLAEPLHCLFHIAVALGERLLALHHANAGRFTQFLDLCSSDCHFKVPPYRVFLREKGGGKTPPLQCIK